MLRLAALLIAASALPAADFHSGQAARAVIGQTSFSSTDAGVSVAGLSLSGGRLLAIDTESRVLTFDLARLPAATDPVQGSADAGCPACLMMTVAAGSPPTFLNSPRIAINGKTVALIDPGNHRVLLWHGGASAFDARKADVTLGGTGGVAAGILIDPVSVATDGKRLFVGDAALHRILVWNTLPQTNGQRADAVLGQPDFDTLRASSGPDADSLGNPAALASDGVNLFVADPLHRRILIFSASDSALSDQAILNSASLLPGPVAPGGLITISGHNLTDATEASPDDGLEQLPRQLAGVQVIVNGLALPLLSVSPGQIRAQVPYDFGGASAVSLLVRAEFADGSIKTTTAAALKVAAARPGLFAFGGPEPRDGLIVHADGSPVTSEKPALPGELITAWAAGLGAVTTSSGAAPPIGVPFEGAQAGVTHPVAGLINGQTVEVSASLPTRAIGVYELKISLPPDMMADATARLAIIENGVPSNTILLPVGKPTQ